MTTKGTPKRDGSGKGIRANKGRGGCKTTQKVGKGRRKQSICGKVKKYELEEQIRILIKPQ